MLAAVLIGRSDTFWYWFFDSHLKTALFVLHWWITFQGFVRQGDCHASLGENREAAKAFGEALKRAESDEEKATILSQILALGVSLEGSVVFCAFFFSTYVQKCK